MRQFFLFVLCTMVAMSFVCPAIAVDKFPLALSLKCEQGQVVIKVVNKSKNEIELGNPIEMNSVFLPCQLQIALRDKKGTCFVSFAESRKVWKAGAFRATLDTPKVEKVGPGTSISRNISVSELKSFISSRYLDRATAMNVRFRLYRDDSFTDHLESETGWIILR